MQYPDRQHTVYGGAQHDTHQQPNDYAQDQQASDADQYRERRHVIIEEQQRDVHTLRTAVRIAVGGNFGFFAPVLAKEAPAVLDAIAQYSPSAAATRSCSPELGLTRRPCRGLLSAAFQNALAGVALILAAFRVDVQPREKAGPGRLQPAQTYAATPTEVPSPCIGPRSSSAQN